tara:strand:+ start:463 stop:675 length:213 start_codon:yes stop_codon:yes gene_type:complete
MEHAMNPRDDKKFGGLSDKIIAGILDSVGLDQSHIDKARDILDMIETTVIEGEEVIMVRVGRNIEIKIKK